MGNTPNREAVTECPCRMHFGDTLVYEHAKLRGVASCDAWGWDAHHLVVCDGVGATQRFGGVYARLLAREVDHWVRSNVSLALDGAAGEDPAGACLRTCTQRLSQLSEDPSTGVSGAAMLAASTATVMLLVHHTLHVEPYGDSQWCLLRAGKVHHMSPPLYYEDERHKGARVPMQVGWRLLPQERPLPRDRPDVVVRMDVQVGDVLIVASDGLWDILRTILEGDQDVDDEERSVRLVSGLLQTLCADANGVIPDATPESIMRQLQACVQQQLPPSTRDDVTIIVSAVGPSPPMPCQRRTKPNRMRKGRVPSTKVRWTLRSWTPP